jgi:hypothetical protein
MPEAFQRLFQRSDWAAPQSLNVQAALGPVRPPERTQYSLLVHHFLDRFFNHETASAASDGKTRLVQIACAAGLPGMVVAMYLWPAYHPFPGWPPGRKGIGPPPYWAQVNHHFFFAMYSFVAMGLITVFEWDLFFPDLLDVLVLGPLPIPALLQFRARVSAIAIFAFGFLFDANILALLVLPLATDPEQLGNFLRGHLSAVALAGLFSAGSVVALQGMLLALFGEKLFRRTSLLLQGTLVAAFLILLFFFPVLSGVTPALLESNLPYAQWFPPFWFLAIFEQHLPGAHNLPTWSELARTGEMAALAVWGAAVVAYPLAHLRRIRALVQGTSTRSRRNWLVAPIQWLLHAFFLRAPLERSVFHFISQTMLRVPRYRIYLVMYGGVGVSLVTATILRLNFDNGHLQAAFSADGLRVAIGIIAFWVVAGLRSAFVSGGNQQAGWIFHSIHGKPPDYAAALPQLEATLRWVFLAASAVTLAAIAGFQFVAPANLRTLPSLAAQFIAGIGLSLVLTDAFFINVTWIPFSGERRIQQDNLAFTVLRYYTFFPIVTALSFFLERSMEHGGAQLGLPVIAIAIAHFWLRKSRRETLRLNCNQVALEEDEDDFPLRLGLRY